MRTYMLELFIERNGCFVVAHKSTTGQGWMPQAEHNETRYYRHVSPATAYRIIKRSQKSLACVDAAVFELYR